MDTGAAGLVASGSVMKPNLGPLGILLENPFHLYFVSYYLWIVAFVKSGVEQLSEIGQKSEASWT